MNKIASKFEKKDFWIVETERYKHLYIRLEKCARIANSLAKAGEYDLLDVGCGPATLEKLLNDNIHYYGIDIAIHEPGANFIESDITKNKIEFGNRKFDMIVAAGLFEYLGEFQSKKLSEIRDALKPNGKFITTYTNFNHIHAIRYAPYNNYLSISEFINDLRKFFHVERYFPSSHNWRGTEPRRKWSYNIQMHFNANIPFFSPKFAINYFFICSLKDQ